MRHSLLVLALLLFAFTAYADLGPKPTVSLEVTYEGQALTEAVDAKLLACHPREQVESEPIPTINAITGEETMYAEKKGVVRGLDELPAYFRILELDKSRECYWAPSSLIWGNCAGSRCEFTYMIPQEIRAAVYLPSKGKVYVSQPVTRGNFNSAFKMDIHEQGVSSLVEDTPLLQQGKIGAFLLSLVITLVLELTLAWFVAWRWNWATTRKLVSRVAVANLISLPLVWFVFPQVLGMAELFVIIWSELFAVGFEAAFLYFTLKPALTKRRALLLSLLLNTVSLILGGFLLVLFGLLLNIPVF